VLPMSVLHAAAPRATHGQPMLCGYGRTAWQLSGTIGQPPFSGRVSWLVCSSNITVAPQVAQQFLQFLLAQRKFAEAAALCPELLKVSR
jgi:hypothetical protein